jgi:hypothetical protein
MLHEAWHGLRYDLTEAIGKPQLNTEESAMRRFIVTSAALVFAASVYANPFAGNPDTYGTVLLDQGAAPTGTFKAPSGPLADAMASSATYGSVLFDRGRGSADRPLAAQPAIGSDADDYGDVLYDLGARY